MDQGDIILKDLALYDCGGQGRIFKARMFNRTDLVPRNVIAKEIDQYNIDKDLLNKELRIKDLNHENVIKVFGFVSSPGSYIVLEYAEHGNLDDFIINSYEILKKNFLQKFKGIINGINFIHSNRILHLDLHPKNILVTSSPKNEYILKLCDFGLSEYDEPDSLFLSVVGRPGYMSPEKVRQGRKTRDSDVWSLGCILWKILTKHEAFDYEDRFAIYYKVGQGLHPDIPTHWPVQIQKLLFYCWDCRYETSDLIKLFNVTTRNNKTDILLNRSMPLEYERRFVKIDTSRIVPPLIWDCLDKNKRFSRYQFSDHELEDFKRKFDKHLCQRKLKKIQSTKDLLQYLNESGYFKDLKELNDNVIDFTEMQRKLYESTRTSTWIRVARTLGMPDIYINEIKIEGHNKIVYEMCEFWIEEKSSFQFSVDGLNKILHFLHLDSE